VQVQQAMNNTTILYTMIVIVLIQVLKNIRQPDLFYGRFR